MGWLRLQPLQTTYPQVLKIDITLGFSVRLNGFRILENQPHPTTQITMIMILLLIGIRKFSEDEVR